MNGTAGIKHAMIDCFASAVFMWYVALCLYLLIVYTYLSVSVFFTSTFVVNKRIIIII